MSIKDFIFLKTVRKLPKSFETWRSDQIANSVKICADLNDDLIHKRPNLHKRYLAIKNLPKTLVRLTRQMCSCDEYCVQYSMHNTEYNFSCTLYGLRDLLDDDQYYDSDLINKKVIYKRIEPMDYIVDEFALNNDFYTNLISLCKNTENALRDLKCVAYELKDYCNDNITCYTNILDDKSKLLYTDFKPSRDICTNPNYNYDLFKLRNKLNMPMIYENTRSKRDIRSLGDSSIKETSLALISATFVSLCGLVIILLKSDNSKLKLFSGLLIILLIGALVSFY